MREIRLSGSEGGVADNGHPYPYQESWVGKVDGSGIGMTWARADGTRRVAYRGGR
jgi:hypothetical protein